MERLILVKNTIEAKALKIDTNLTPFISQQIQSTSPVLAFLKKHWILLALVGSLGYLTYFFSEQSLPSRIQEMLTDYEERGKVNYRKKGQPSVELGLASPEDKKGAGSQKVRTPPDSYRLGYFLGRVAVEWKAVFAVLLFVIAIAELSYRYLFRRLYEKDRIGQVVYTLIWLIAWFALKIAISLSSKDQAVKDAEALLLYPLIPALYLHNLFKSWRDSFRRQATLLQEKTQAELEALKAQVNPHFLFNTLNNLYGTALMENSPRTAESIQQLSGIMRYVMEESRVQVTDIRRELKFINDYIELQEIRLPRLDTIRIETDIEWDEQPVKIAPLLLNPLIENAFKYGISIQHSSFVRIFLRVEKGQLNLKIENSIPPRTDLEKGAGSGLANVRQRLALAYPGKHRLLVEESPNNFSVILTIKL
ncbi:sensor histidine kinase [Tellurirhabdus bombi]|uniref:sensor histidine kinase n=1 Tax=Tellurirhabdus bombi TaxID=2907205 RepID=UPI001F21156F|nr:histidine kinase [Tellurirhabdus bombi]